jgi:hypothetical protein
LLLNAQLPAVIFAVTGVENQNDSPLSYTIGVTSLTVAICISLLTVEIAAVAETPSQ